MGHTALAEDDKLYIYIYIHINPRQKRPLENEQPFLHVFFAFGIQYSTVSALQRNTIQYSIVQYEIEQYSRGQYSAAQRCALQ